MDLDKLSLNDKIIGGAGLALVIDLLFLPWHSVDLGFTTFTRKATQSPNGMWGWLALLVALATVVTLLLDRLSDVELPELPIEWAQAWVYGTFATAAIVLLKFISETEGLGFGSYLGILLAGGMAYGGFQMMQENKDGGGAAGAPPAPPTEF